MSLQALTCVVVGLTFALYIGIAFWSRAHNTGDFYIAGKGVSPIANGMATAADWMSAASFISMAGLIAFLGYDGSVYLMGWTGGYVLLALLLAPCLRKFGKFTVPEFIAERFYSGTARIVAVICLIFISFTYVAGQMRGVGIVFSRFLEVEVTVGLIIGMGVVFVYAVLDDIVTSLGFNQYTSGSKSRIDVFCITMALMVGTAGLLLFTYGYIEYFKGLFLRWAGAPWGDNVADQWLFGISPEGIGVVGMCLNFAVAIAVSSRTRPPPERIQHMVEHIRVPRQMDSEWLDAKVSPR